MSGRRAAVAGGIVTAAVAWLLAIPHAAQERPLFRAGTDLIQVDVSVLDSRRHPVKGLAASDFTLLVDGRPRPIEAFTEVDLPDRQITQDVGWTAEVPADVVTNRTVSAEGRLVVILMDRTIPLGTPTVTARDVAIAAVDALGPGDLAALVSTGGGVPQNFTSDRARLLRAINQRDWSTDVSDDAKAIEGGVGLTETGFFTPLTDPRCLCGLCVPETITRVAGALQDVARRRKSLLFIGSDFIVQAGPQPARGEIGCGQKLKDARETMFAALDRSGVIVHAFDPTGLVTRGPIGQASSPLRPVRAAAARESAVENSLAQQGNLHVVPDHTGGRVVTNTNGPHTLVPEVMRESQSYYLIGFRPDASDAPGTAHSIAVKVNRGSLDVQTRRRFSILPSSATGSKAGTEAPAAALTGLLPEPRLALDVNLAAFATPAAATPTVVVTAAIDAFAPAVDAAARDTPLEVVVAALTPAGQVRATARQTVTLSWPIAGAGAKHVEAVTRLAVAPGDYEIRVSVENTETKQVASVYSYLIVPPFASVPLSLSSIVVEAAKTTTSVPAGSVQSVLPVVPTTARTFTRGESTGAFMHIYQGTRRDDPLSSVVLRARIMDAQGRAVRDEALTFAAAMFQASRTAEARLAVPTSLLAPGEYLLQLEATMGERVAGRAMRFAVAP